MSTHGSQAAVTNLAMPEVLRAADELFSTARKYRSSVAYKDLLDFVVRFRAYSPYNAMLLHVQMAGAHYVAPASRWEKKYGRRVKPDARPLVILQPRGPVMFVFDVSDTEPKPGAPELPAEVTDPFSVRKGRLGEELSRSIWNAWRDGIQVVERGDGSQSAGLIRTVEKGLFVTRAPKAKNRPNPESNTRRYELILNGKHDVNTRYATLVHELGHLYCGHLGTPTESWWPARDNQAHQLCEFEAETVSYLVCSRLGLETPSAEYLSTFFRDTPDVPNVSMEGILKAAGLIEQMGRENLPDRKPEKSAS